MILNVKGEAIDSLRTHTFLDLILRSIQLNFFHSLILGWILMVSKINLGVCLTFETHIVAIKFTFNSIQRSNMAHPRNSLCVCVIHYAFYIIWWNIGHYCKIIIHSGIWYNSNMAFFRITNNIQLTIVNQTGK